ncbi:MAG TPA: hypothetical protein VF585_12015 [Chthoniobacterales bacterium]
MKWLSLLLLLLVSTLEAAPLRFDLEKDTFAFGNETLWAYGNQRRDAGSPVIETGRPYSRRCFVMVRAAIQFHQFAEFAPAQSRVSEAEYQKLVRRISRIPVSQKRNRARISIPGFADLQSFSKAYPALLQENLGNWWPTYLRIGNWRMGMPFPRSQQAGVAKRLVEALDSGSLSAIYITRFKPLNHCLLVYGYERTSNGISFSVYDPNLPGKKCLLTFDNVTRSFDYQKTWYYKGGRINVIRVYHSRLF